MVTNKKFTLPNPNNSTLNFQKKNSPLLYPPPQKPSIPSKINTPPPEKKINLPNLHDLERFHKNCACSLSTL